MNDTNRGRRSGGQKKKNKDNFVTFTDDIYNTRNLQILKSGIKNIFEFGITFVIQLSLETLSLIHIQVNQIQMQIQKRKYSSRNTKNAFEAMILLKI